MTSKLHRGTMIGILCVICTRVLLSSSSGLSFIEAGHGQEVTLVPTYHGDPEGISWWLRGHILVDIKLKPSHKIYYYSNFDRVKDRADINPSNGRLTIRGLTKEDAGYYRAETVVDGGDQVTHLWLIVIDEELDGIVGVPGSDVTMDLKYKGEPTSISWWRGSHILLEMKRNPAERIAFYSLKGRADIDRSTGRLTLRKLIAQDSGVYRAEMVVNNGIQTSTIRLSIRE